MQRHGVALLVIPDRHAQRHHVELDHGGLPEPLRQDLRH